MNESVQAEIIIRSYENAVTRQQYFSDFCRQSFNFYVKVVGWVCVAVAALVSYAYAPKMGNTQTITFDHIEVFVDGSVYIVYILGIITIFQIAFCLFRWYFYRLKESELTEGRVKAEKWAFLLETGYAVGIAISIYFYHMGIANLLNQLQNS